MKKMWINRYNKQIYILLKGSLDKDKGDPNFFGKFIRVEY